MRDINKIIIHCADTKPSMDIGVKEIDSWHKQRGWSGVGYHFIIRKDGSVELGRPIEKIGAHCKGYNRDSIAICWVGGYGGVDDRNEEQIESMHSLVQALQHDFPAATVHGHNEFSSKSCPNFDVSKEF